MRKPSAETELRKTKRDLKDAVESARSWQELNRSNYAKASHYEKILQAIANGHYPDGQAPLAAKHALDAWVGR